MVIDTNTIIDCAYWSESLSIPLLIVCVERSRPTRRTKAPLFNLCFIYNHDKSNDRICEMYSIRFHLGRLS